MRLQVIFCSRRNTILLPTACLLSLAIFCGQASAQRPRLGFDEQPKVDGAIQEGMRYIAAHQAQDGSFTGPAGHPVGVTSLAGLALLESGVSKKDPAIQAAVNYILTTPLGETLDDTYDLSLAILFLDKYGDPKNKQTSYVIRMFATRLIGGQTTTGGWSYKCPTFTKRDQDGLLDLLRKMEDLEKPERMAGITSGPSTAPSGSASQSAAMALAGLPRPGMCIKTADDTQVAEQAKPAEKQEPAGREPPRPRTINVSGKLGLLPVLQVRHKLGKENPSGVGNIDEPIHQPHSTTTRSDNSNTQFAILAIWAATKYQIPTQRTLELVVKRFRESQSADGGWVYGYTKGGGGDGTPAMTCSGLAGLAVGFGMSDVKQVARKEDEQLVKRGFRCLMKFVGEPSEKLDKRIQLVENNNLYYLWSIERVAVMYNLPTLGNREWYRWGVEILLGNQTKGGPNNGAWMEGGNTSLNDPVVNTAFALLFLRGANLTADLTARLPINPEELNKELAGEIASSLRTTPTIPGKETSPLGGNKSDGDRPIDDIQAPEAPKTAVQQPQPVQQPPQQQQPTPAGAPAGTTAASDKKQEGGGNGLMIAIFAGVAVVVIAGAGAAIFFATRGKKTEDDKPRAAKSGRRPSRDDDEEEEEETPRKRRAPPPERAEAKKPTKARAKNDSSSL
jgi:hypothetical protein